MALVYNSRLDAEEHGFHPLVSVLVPLLALMLQVYLPRLFRGFALFDLPLIVTIYFSVARRNPILGTLTGEIIGLLQDALSGLPIGINGIAKSIVGFSAASVGVRIDVENSATRFLMNFGFTLLSSIIYILITRVLLGTELAIGWTHELLRALANALLAVPLFLLMDFTKRGIS
jgi:rod shape-determining protein MreD